MCTLESTFHTNNIYIYSIIFLYNHIVFQNASSWQIEALEIAYYAINNVILRIVRFIGVLMLRLYRPYNKFLSLTQLPINKIEFVITLFPMFLLSLIILPSFVALYSSECLFNFRYPIFVKIIGHQWYWDYQIFNPLVDSAELKKGFLSESFSSYLIKDTTRLFTNLDSNTSLVLPYGINFFITTRRDDVIHSWTLPALGIKIDAIPGRVNSFVLSINKPGVYYGQCSEICGMDHRFIPIMLTSVAAKDYGLMFKRQF